MFVRVFGRREKPRVLEHQSTREIADLKKKIKTELKASIYFFDNSKFIICSIVGSSEYGKPIVLDMNTKDEVLGEALCDALLRFKPQNIVGETIDKASDWEAYIVSGEKICKSFELKSTFIFVNTQNSALDISACPRISNEKRLSAVCSVSTHSLHIEIGSAIRKAIGASHILREAGAL